MVPKDAEIRRRSYWNVVCTMYVVVLAMLVLSIVVMHPWEVIDKFSL